MSPCAQTEVTYGKVGKSVEHLHRVLLCGVVNIPVVNRGVRDEAEGGLAEPFPVDNILIHDRRLEFLFRGEVEDLDGSALGLESNDVLAPVHDRTVGVDGALHDIVVVLQIDNDDLRLVIFIELLPNADVMIRF